MTWKQTDIVASALGLDAVLKGVQTVAQTVLPALEAIQALLDAAIKLLPILEGEAFDVDVILNQLLASVEIVHLYPLQPYQPLTFTRWAGAVGKSLRLGTSDLRYEYQPRAVADLLGEQAACLGAAPYTVLVIGVSDATAKGVLTKFEPLLSLFGRTRSGIKDIPQILDRTLLSAPPSNCSPLLDLLPYLRIGTGLMLKASKTSTASPLALLRDAVIEKIEAIQADIAEIQTFLEAINTLKIPSVWAYAGSVDDLTDLPNALLTSGGPKSSHYFAGSAMVGSGTAIGILSTLLGI